MSVVSVVSVVSKFVVAGGGVRMLMGVINQIGREYLGIMPREELELLRCSALLGNTGYFRVNRGN